MGIRSPCGPLASEDRHALAAAGVPVEERPITRVWDRPASRRRGHPLIPVATTVDALLSLALVTVLVSGLIAYEATRFREARQRIRQQLA